MKKSTLPILLLVLFSLIYVPVAANCWIFTHWSGRREGAVAFVQNAYPNFTSAQKPYLQIQYFPSGDPSYSIYTDYTGNWVVKTYHTGSLVELNYSDGEQSLEWSGLVVSFVNVTVLSSTYTPSEPVVLTGRTTPTKIAIAYDLWEYMLMPWESANPIAGFHIYEAGVYRIQAWQNAVLVWESPLLFVWHNKGVNLVYYVGGARFTEGQITFILMKSGLSVDTYVAP